MKSRINDNEHNKKMINKYSKSIKNFHFKKLKINLHQNVYEPAEDTFKLIEALKIKISDKVLEIGTGCGIIALECARLGANVIAVDINPYALKIARKNYLQNKNLLKGSVEFRFSDIFSGLNKNEIFDVIIFNPPYLPTRPRDYINESRWFDIAIDGGADGLELTKRFLQDLNIHLKKYGYAYFVFSSLSNRNKLHKYLNKAGLKSEIILDCWFDDEKIDIYRVYFK